MKKIYVVGSLSTGKTTLINRTAEVLRANGFRVGIVRDPAWDFIENFGGISCLADQFLILDTWREDIEKQTRAKPDFLFFDGGPFLAIIYSYLHEPEFQSNPSPDNKMAWAKFRHIKDKIRRDVEKDMTKKYPMRFKKETFDFLFYLPVEFSAVPGEGRRYLDKQQEVGFKIRAFLDVYLWQDPRWHIVKGDPDERVNQVLGIILR